jgi:hypothetical protein
MGDPSSALEGLVEVLDKIPREHKKERMQVQKLINELASIV